MRGRGLLLVPANPDADEREITAAVPSDLAAPLVVGTPSSFLGAEGAEK